MSYDETPIDDKFLTANESIRNSNGQTIRSANEYWKKQYEQTTPMPAKFLLPDGTIVDELPTSGGGGGITDYNDLTNKPKINGNILSGDKSANELNLATKTEVDNKVDKVTGKQLSTNDYTNDDKAKVKAISETVQTVTTTNTYLCIENMRDDTLLRIKQVRTGRVNTVYFENKLRVVFTESFGFAESRVDGSFTDGTKAYIRELKVFVQDNNLYIQLSYSIETFEISYVGEHLTMTITNRPALKRSLSVFHENNFIEGDYGLHWKFSRNQNFCLASQSLRIKTPYGESILESSFRNVINPSDDMDDVDFYFKDLNGHTLYIGTHAYNTVADLMDKFESITTIFPFETQLFACITGDFYGQSESGASDQYFPCGLTTDSMMLQFKCYTSDPMGTACWFNMCDYNVWGDYDIDITTQTTLGR